MRPVLVLALGLLLSGCAALKGPEAPGCSGPRRSANPNGSVLAVDTSPAAPAAATTGICAGASK